MENDALLCLVELCYYGEELFQIDVTNNNVTLSSFYLQMASVVVDIWVIM